jgi:amino acid adenylation domain-containing protein
MSHRTKPIDLPLQQQAIRAKCFHPTGIFTVFKREEIEQSIPTRFAQQVHRYPNQLAIKTKHHTFTYTTLNHLANRMAHVILAQCGEGSEPVALLFAHDAPMIAAILAVLKSGKICVPLDPAYPPARLTAMLTDAQTRLLVTDTAHLSLAQTLIQSGCSVLNIDGCDAHFSAENPHLSLSPDLLAYIFYTSGSTGQPKGVVQNHRNLLHKCMLYTNDLHLCADDRLSLLHSCSFAASVRHIFAALLNGAALFPFDLHTAGVPHLAAWLIREQITICHSPASVFRHFASMLSGVEQFPALRVLYVANEPVSKREVELYKAHFSPECLFVNALVASEALTMRQFFLDKETPLPGSMVPVGYAVQDEEILLLDEEGNEVGVNQIGEIAVKSRYLALGYWQKPELTRTAFVPDPTAENTRIYRTGDLGHLLPDGCLVHLGRKDFHQIKIRGHRVEVAEVEMALLDHEAIKEAVVMPWKAPSEDTRLVAYLVSSQEPVPTIRELRSFLQARLPEYMVPTVFVLLETLPRTPNGKVDRRMLPAPTRERLNLHTAFVAPRTAVEETLASIWATVLGVEQVGIYDNFFELGGHSLLATQVLSRLRNIFQVELSLRSFFEAPTIAKLADTIEDGKPSEVKIRTSAITPLLREQYRMKMSF